MVLWNLLVQWRNKCPYQKEISLNSPLCLRLSYQFLACRYLKHSLFFLNNNYVYYLPSLLPHTPLWFLTLTSEGGRYEWIAVWDATVWQEWQGCSSYMRCVWRGVTADLQFCRGLKDVFVILSENGVWIWGLEQSFEQIFGKLQNEKEGGKLVEIWLGLHWSRKNWKKLFMFVVVRPVLSTLTVTCFEIDGDQIPGKVGVPTFKESSVVQVPLWHWGWSVGWNFQTRRIFFP